MLSIVIIYAAHPIGHERSRRCEKADTMISLYRFGDPIDTEAVLEKPEVATGPIGYFTAHLPGEPVEDVPLGAVADNPDQTDQVGIYAADRADKLSFSYIMGADDVVFGLGEQINGMNKRNFTYVSRCMDGARHTEDRQSLYAAHNFLLVRGERTFGAFFDCAGIISFDIGETDIDLLAVTLDDPDVDVYIIEGDGPDDIVRQFRTLIGRSYIPPKWAFGYHQSRWFYKCEEDFREIERRYREARIPLDAIYMDIDYMDDYKSFTVDRKHFPHFEDLVREMSDAGVHLVPIIDAGIKVEPGYSVYEEGVAQNRFCKTVDGKDFTCGVWPGHCHLVDVLDPENRRWFGDQYQKLLDMGIDGIWNDMNEPSIFYTEERLADAYATVDELRSSELDLNTYFAMRSKFARLSSNPEDYKLFYHNVNGKKVRHDKVHNLYGYNLSRAAGEAFERLSPGKRILFFSRGSMIGMHRVSGIWTGDNMAWWSHLRMSVCQMPNIQMCGFLFTGSDVGGFGSDTNEELMTRWLQFAVFAPLMRNHSQSRRAQELYTFKHVDTMRNIVKLRYALVPYLYSEFVKAALSGDLYFKPLSFVYEDDERALRVEDQLMVGESLMIAPVVEQNARGRMVYLPEPMRLLRFRALDDYDVEDLPAGDVYVRAELNEMLLFIRLGHMVPLAAPAQTTRDMDFEHLRVWANPALGEDPAAMNEYVLYDDDGYTTHIDDPAHFHTIRLGVDGVSCATKHVELVA